MNKIIITSLLLFVTITATAEPAPEIEWEVLYGSIFNDVRETTDGNYIVAGCNYIVAGYRWDGYSRILLLYSPSGSLIWEYGESECPRTLITSAVIQITDGDFVAIGYGISNESSTQYSLSIDKVSSEGETIWSKLYELTEGNSRGYDLTPLPDGGFAICGEIDPEEGMDQAWILRTDAQGDTLWTREWGWDYNDKAMKVLYIDNGLTVLTHGRLQTTTGGPHVVRYDLDGNLLWETDIPELAGDFAQDMCEASDEGLLILDSYRPYITHTDYYGNYDWQFSPPGWGSDWGWCIDTTMDGGIIFGGENAWTEPDGSKSDLSGMISRHDSLGNELWRDYVYNSGCRALNSVRQLSQGGYIAAGKAFSPENGTQGILIKYAPEVGIEHGEEPSAVVINLISPNPVSLTASIEFSLAESGSASLALYDLNGRVVDIVSEGIFAEGSNIVDWTVSENLSNGCYLLRLSSDTENVTRNVVILR